jgi:fumarate hydratase class I
MIIWQVLIKKGSIGGPAAILAQNCIKKVELLEYPELGMEAIYKIEVVDFPW